VTAIIASILASLPAYGLSALLEGHVSESVDMVLSFVVWAVLFVPAFVWIKRMRDGG
jgi:hypothetical protein